jgi:hypothetical protein
LYHFILFGFAKVRYYQGLGMTKDQFIIFDSMKVLFKLAFLIFIFNGFLSLNAQNIQQQLSSLHGISFKQIPNDHFKEYYEIFIQQPIDHNNTSSKKFKQRIFLGFNSIELPTLVNTDGYGIDYASKQVYQNELATLLNTNLITIEHRYLGKSVPDSINYDFLTVKQAAADAHEIVKLFSSIFKKSWISTGISKGGQAALAFKLFYPEDVKATIVYGTAVKKALNETKIDSMLTFFEKTPCGNALEQIRINVFKNKKEYLELFKNHIIQKSLLLKQFDLETYFDYLLLELPFSFLQNGNKCVDIPPVSAGTEKIFNFIISIVPPKFYDSGNMNRLKPAYYMSYHELGYYEYNTTKYKAYLHKDNYSNKNFAPENININFDKTYLDTLNKFLQTTDAGSIVFIYGENDPWSSMQHTGRAGKEIIKNGSHKSRIADMKPIQKENLIIKLNSLIK